MKNHVATAMALALVAGAAGLSAVPIAAATGNCVQDFLIPDSEPVLPRSLAASAAETGVEEVSDGEDEVLRMELVSPNDKLEFQILEIVDNDCQTSANVDGCSATEFLDTTGGQSEDSKECTLEAPPTGTRTFYVHVVNLQSSDGLLYKAFIA